LNGSAFLQSHFLFEMGDVITDKNAVVPKGNYGADYSLPVFYDKGLY